MSNVDILKKAPRIGGQEGKNIKDMKVYAIFRIPFRSDWSWYLTEYNPENHEAFGFVLGDTVEWGSFFLDELRELGAVFVPYYNLPKTTEQLKDIDLVNEMTEKELKVFFGENK